jgi:8-oxo-dGTP pyrophosphatase MutT (NUDIX family)
MKDKSVRIIALTSEGEVLLQFRDGKRKNEYDYTFVFMGGAIDAGEDALTAAVREFGEETGIHAQPEDFSLIMEGMAHKYGPVTFYKYAKSINRAEVKLTEGAGFAFVKYEDLSRLPLGSLMKWFIEKCPELPA